MPVTVDKLLQLESLADARLLAGKDGLSRTVTSVTVGEVPDIADWLSGGEIVLSTMFALINDLDRQRDFCRRIMSAGAAALFVKPKRFVGEFPQDVLEIANKRGFPIVEVPQQVRWTLIMQQAMEVIINRHATLLERSQEIHRELLEVVIRGGGWDELAAAAAGLAEMPVCILDMSLEPLALSVGFPVGLPVLREALSRPDARVAFAGLSRTSSKVARLELEGVQPMLVVPVIVSRRPLGYVCALCDHSQLQEMQRLALEHAATIAAVEMAQDQVRFETEVRLKGDFIDDLIGDRFSSEDSLLHRANFLGSDLSRGATVMLLQPEVAITEAGRFAPKEAAGEEEVQQVVERYFGRCARYLSDIEPTPLVSLKSGRIIILLCGDEARNASRPAGVAERLKRLAKDSGDLSVSVGIGRFAGETSGLARSFGEAQIALKIGRRLGGEGSIMEFEKVGTYKLLFAVWEKDPAEVEAIYRETIRPIERYDEANDGQLVHTLSVYLGNDESLAKTSESLYAHRHTVRYRLNKIAELCGLSVFKSQDKERLSLGLKARDLLKG